MMVILNHHLGMATTFHDILYGLCDGRGTGNTSLETNLLQQLETMREEVLHEILPDLHNTYYELDRERYHGILTTYRVGSRAICLL